MGKGACIKFGYIEVDTDAWLAETTGGEIPELTDLYRDFDRCVHKNTYLRLDTVPMFIVARSGPDWADEDFAVISTEDGGSQVGLSEDFIVQRYIDPVHGPVALVTTEYQYLAGDTTAYSDSGFDSSNWFSYNEVDIFCPQGHGWSYRGGDLTDDQGNYQTVKEVFPEGVIVTHDDNIDSDTYMDDRIICPTCGQLCDVAIPGH